MIMIIYIAQIPFDMSKCALQLACIGSYEPKASTEHFFNVLFLFSFSFSISISISILFLFLFLFLFLLFLFLFLYLFLFLFLF